MFYKGYIIKYIHLPNVYGKLERTLAIFDRDKRLATVSNDMTFAQHVIDVNINFGKWPNKEECKFYTPEKEVPEKRKRGRPRKDR